MKGFTLVEVIISFGIVAVIAGMSAPVYKIMQQKNDLATAEFAVASTLRRAQLLAQAAKGDSDWGVHIENYQITVFKGQDYSSRDVNSDEVFSISPHISTSGLTDIIFNQLTGFPELTGLITLSAPDDSRNITINERGSIEY